MTFKNFPLIFTVFLSYFYRNIFPTICQVLFGVGSKGEVRVAAAETLRALQLVLLPSPTSPVNEKRKEKDREKDKEKGNENSDKDKLLWTWCKDTSQQEEIKRLTTVSF